MVKELLKIPSVIIRFLIIFYKKIISPALPNACRFYPSCSEYALVAVETHGAFFGTLKAAYRLLRCHPFNAGGHDPVSRPPKVVSFGAAQLNEKGTASLGRKGASS